LKKKPIKFKTDADTYFDLAEEAFGASDYINAVHYFYIAYTLSLKDKEAMTDALFFLGEIYLDVGEYEEALYYLFKALDRRPDCTDINNTIASCFLCLNDEDTAIFYSWAGMSVKSYKDLMHERDDLINEYQLESKKIRLLEKNDQMIIDIAAKLLTAGDKKYAKELLQTVKPNSPDFLKACNLLIMICLEDKQAKEALEIIDEALSQNQNKKESGIFLEFRCWQIVSYHILKDKENKQRVIDIIEAASLDFHASRAAVFTYAKINDYKRIRRHIEDVLKKDAFNKNMRVMLSIAHHLCGDEKNAKIEIVAASKLYPNDIAIKEIALAISQKRKGLILAALMDKKTTASWIDDIEEALDLIAKNRYEDVPQKSEFIKKIEWVFQSRLNSLITHAALILGSNHEFKDFLMDRLTDYELETAPRKTILYSLLVNNAITKFGIVIDGFYQRLSFKPLNTHNKILFKAYCKTFATLVFMENGFETRLNNAAKKIEDRFDELKLNDDEDMLSALLFALSIKAKLPLSHSAFIFSCDEHTLKTKFDLVKAKK